MSLIISPSVLPVAIGRLPLRAPTVALLPTHSLNILCQEVQNPALEGLAAGYATLLITE